MSEKKILSFWQMFMICMLRRQNKRKKNFRLSVCLAVCTWTFHVDTIAFEGVSRSNQNLLGVFYVRNVRLVLKSNVKWIDQSWSKSWSWTKLWFSQKLCGATPNLVDIFGIWRITCSNEFHSEILILKKKNSKKKFAEQN